MFPVKYRKALLEEEVVEIIKETAIGIQERYTIEFEVLGMDKRSYSYTLQCTPKGSTWGDSTDIQEHNSEGGFQEKADDKEGIMGRGVLDRWILCCDCRGEGKLEDSGEIHRKTR